MILHRWKRPVSPAELRQQLGPVVASGGFLQALEQYAWENGLWVHASRGDMAMIKNHVQAGVPPLVAMRQRADDPTTKYFAVVVAYDDVGRQVLCHDGQAAPSLYGYKDFQTKWRAEDSRMVVICQPRKETWDLSPGERFDRGRFYEANARHRDAAKDYRTVLSSLPDHSVVRLRLGNVVRALGDLDEAERLYRKAIELDPKHTLAYNNLAYLLAENSKSLDEAVFLAEQAALIEPTNPFILDTLGYALLQQGKYKRAADTLERARGRAVRLKPEKQGEIALHLVRAHLGNRDTHLARQVLKDACSIDPTLDVPKDLRYLLGKR